MATVFIPALLRDLTGNAERVVVEIPEGQTRTVREVVEELGQRYPGIAERLLDEGELVPSLAVFINSEQISMGLMARIHSTDELYFLAPIVGG